MMTNLDSGITKGAVESVFEEHAYLAQDNWKISCPFHGPERTPSFFIHRLRLVCHCFGCGRSGPVDSLAAEYAGITREQARDKLGITGDLLFDSVKVRESVTPSTFPESWLAQWPRIRTHPYCKARGFEEDTLIAFDARWDSQHQRVVFPLRARSGALFGASGRSVRDEYPKWLFYWNCNKGSHLFVNKHYSPGSGLIVVEGLFDLLWLHQQGFYNACCLNGSTATRLQIRELRSLASTVILGLDNDDAGREGERKLFKALRKSSIVEFVSWPEDANDWMDLADVSETLGNTLSPVQKYNANK